MHFYPGTMTTHAESINSDLQRVLDRRLRHDRRYIELKLSIPMAEIISTAMTCKYNRGTNYHRFRRTKNVLFFVLVEVEDITTRVFSFTIDYMSTQLEVDIAATLRHTQHRTSH